MDRRARSGPSADRGQLAALEPLPPEDDDADDEEVEDDEEESFDPVDGADLAAEPLLDALSDAVDVLRLSVR